MSGQYHRANTRHSRDEVTAAVKKIKAQHPEFLLTTDEIAAVVSMDSFSSDNDDYQKEDEVQLAGRSDEDDEGDAMALVDEDDSATVEVTITYYEFLHRREYETDMLSALAVMSSRMRIGEGHNFEGIWIDTAVNRRSVMGRPQYDA